MGPQGSNVAVTGVPQTSQEARITRQLQFTGIKLATGDRKKSIEFGEVRFDLHNGYANIAAFPINIRKLIPPK
jgi:hypothetical protein